MRAVLLLVVVGASLPCAAAHAERLVDVRPVARGGYLAPRFSPTGEALAVTGPRLRGLFLVGLADGGVRRLNDEVGAGIHARFLADGRLAFRVRRAGAEHDLAIRADGGEDAIAPSRLAEVVDDRLYVRRPDGTARQVGAGDRFFAPLPSPDGRRIAVQGLVTGLWIHDRVTARLSHVGRGTAPAWSPDGTALVFERTEDDGHDVVASELMLYRTADGTTRPLTATAERIERRPSFSPDGGRVAFDDGAGGVFVAALAGGPP